ncbi:unnamed protein product [Larinioides sclopetarius]|uniref:microsomal epoxide hydrolase n=1 Tax=Larinioides sclopetarius TaxID=280406 RepID=A0AAV2BB60_9ARAC
MQLNQTSMTFDDFIQYFLPSYIFRLYRGIKKIYKASTLFSNVFIIHLFMIFFRENNKSTDLYRKVWEKRNSDKEAKDIDKNASNIRPFKICVPHSLLDDLKSRLGRAQLNPPSRNSSYSGFSLEHLKKLTDYWKTKFDWRKNEQELNKYPQFKTKIGDIDLHFLHFKSRQRDSKMKIIPLLLIHNWPGSFADFQEVIPILQTSCVEHGLVFEIVCPSIPGCGFSEAPHQSEFSAKNLSEILLALMDRLQYTEFYVHGYGWGAVTASLMARYYPYRVKGMHVNMCFALPNLFDSFIKTLIVYICPIFINKAEYNIIFPLKKKIRMLFQETGFLHLQCSKPNTFGYAMTDSPTSLAIHLLEKFHFKKNSGHLELQDEELTEKFLDNLLTLVTILWTSNDFTNGARFFKQCMSDILKRTYESEIPLTVPCGVAFFPDEIFMLPKYMMENTVEDLVSYTVMPRGGHFAALEEPLLLAKDICKFVQLVDIRSTLKIK